MARTRSVHYDDQRGLILARAAELFATQGYAATSMNEVARACGLSKPALYHYFADKYALLLDIADRHVSRLVATVEDTLASTATEGVDASVRLRRLIERLVGEYADAQHAHRVLTEDVRFLNEADRARVLGKQRQVVDAFAREVSAIRPDARAQQWVKPLTMLLFGMVNWMFTWHRPEGPVSHEAMGPLVADVFTAGILAARLDTVGLPAGAEAVNPAAADAAAQAPIAVSDADIAQRTVELLRSRPPESSICPSDVARSLSSDEATWRGLMPQVRRVASDLAGQALVRITQGSVELSAGHLEHPLRGAIRLRRGSRFVESGHPTATRPSPRHRRH
jgi:TetR/AcrR family transcriptional regulator